ncbi:MAG: Coenzyme F420 hydrogenase/dehydrogenase, beta subunit C-terminal domain [Promethearchaeota archaeon]
MLKKTEKNYDLNSDLLGIGFQTLKESIVNENNCVLCGLCASLCPRIEMNEVSPLLLEYDPECSMCFRYCTRTHFPMDIVEKEIFNEGTKKDILIGYHRALLTGKSTDEQINNQAQNGGMVSSLLINALEKGFIDGALLTAREPDWKPKPIIARTSEEILSAMGSKYTIAPSLLTYREAIDKYHLKNLAFVGMPCQIRAVRKLQLYPPLSESFGQISLIIGLYCSANFSDDLLHEYIKKNLNLSLNNIKKMDISKGKFILTKEDGVILKIPLKEILPYKWPGCETCKDYTAELADISIGSVGAQSDDWNSIIIRTKRGEEMFNDAIKSKKIMTSPEVQKSQIEKASLRKKLEKIKINGEIIKALNYLNVSDIQIRIYGNLVSLSESPLELLKKALDINDDTLLENLNSLMKRGWIYKNNGYYYPNNPKVVLEKEIRAYQEEFKRQIEEVRQKALIPLKKMFLRNNSERLELNDFLDYP